MMDQEQGQGGVIEKAEKEKLKGQGKVSLQGGQDCKRQPKDSLVCILCRFLFFINPRD